MKKKLITLFLAVILSLSCIPAYAAGQTATAEDTPSTAVVETQKTTAAFSQEEVDSVLNGQTDGPITIQEIQSLLDIPAENRSFWKSGAQYATVYDFLYLYMEQYGQRFVTYTGDAFLYPAGDSMWMSADEWAYFVDHIDTLIRRSSVLIVLMRTQQCEDFLRARHIPDTYERYKEVVDAFYPEFSDFVDENREAVEFWIKPFSPTGNQSYIKTYFSTLLHELQHEISAKKSNTFDRRAVVNNSWAVYSRKPSTYYYYNVAQKEWVSIDPISVPASSSMIDPSTPEAMKNTMLYELYYSGNSSSNNWGLYGLLLEFASSEITLRTDVLSTSIDYHYDKVPALTQEMCYFWEGSVLHYLAGLQEKKPEAYAQIMEDKQLLQLIVDLSSYTKEQLLLAPSIDLDSDTLGITKNWAHDDVAKAQMTAIQGALNS